MSTEIKKLAELEYDEMITLAVIESDDILSDIFKEEIKISFNMIRTIAKDNELNKETKELLLEIFEGIILPTKRYINKYIGFGGVAISNGFIDEVVVDEIIEIENPITEDKVEKPTSVKKEKTLPKWYGSQQILKDIEKQGGKSTIAQKTALDINKLKNIYMILNSRLIKMMLTEEIVLTEAECRTIQTSIKTLDNKLKTIIKKR
jgi:hypothetical protein